MHLFAGVCAAKLVEEAGKFCLKIFMLEWFLTYLNIHGCHLVEYMLICQNEMVIRKCPPPKQNQAKEQMF